MKKIIKQFLFLLDKQAKKAIPFLIISFFLSSFLDIIGIGLVGVFLTLLVDPNFLIRKVPFLTKIIPSISDHKLIIVVGLLIITAIAVKSIAIIAIQKRMFLFAQSFSLRLKMRLMTTYQYAPYIFHLQKNSDYLLTRVTLNIDGMVNNMLMSFLTLTSNLLMALFILLFLLTVHPIPTLVLLGLLTSVCVAYDFLVKKNLSHVGEIIAESGIGIYKSIRHALRGLTEIRVLNKETFFITTLQNKHRENLAANAVLNRQQITPRYLIENMIAIFTIVISLGGVILGYNAASILALVGMFAVAGARLLPTVSQVITCVNQIRIGSRHVGVVYNEFKEAEQLVKDSSYDELAYHDLTKSSFKTIQLNKVSFNYPDRKISAIKNINLEINKGQSIGLVGPSGAGKSTLINLILGFLEPQEGKIFIDGQPIKNLRAWLNNFAYIPQTIFLLDDTLERNIAFGLEDKDIDKERLSFAIKMAQLTEVVNNLPQGVNTPIGENGTHLSGGQRQRVALARAFYNERDIIVLDEATSSLDNETEKEVIDTIKRLKGHKTLLVIAHRLSTVEHCDVLYRLENGSITKTGTFKEVVGSVL